MINFVSMETVRIIITASYKNVKCSSSPSTKLEILPLMRHLIAAAKICKGGNPISFVKVK